MVILFGKVVELLRQESLLEEISHCGQDFKEIAHPAFSHTSAYSSTKI